MIDQTEFPPERIEELRRAWDGLPGVGSTILGLLDAIERQAAEIHAEEKISKELVDICRGKDDKINTLRASVAELYEALERATAPRGGAGAIE